MSETPSATPKRSLVERAEGVWLRARDHKVIQWALAYFGAAFVLAQVEQIVAQTYGWAPVISRAFVTLLVVLIPVAMTLAWYQGYRGLKRFSRNEILIIAAFLFLGAGVLMWIAPQAGTFVQSAVTHARIEPEGAAVPGFDVLSGGEPAKIFAETLSDQIVSTLSNRQIHTLSGSDAAGLKGASRDVAAANLGVGFIVSGTISSAQGLHVTVHLDRVATHTTLWSETFDQAFADESDFSARVAGTVSDELSAVHRALSIDAHEMTDDALGLYLKIVANSRDSTRPVLEQQRAFLRQLIASAPHLSYGYSSLAGVDALLLADGQEEDPAATRAESRAAVQKALALNPRDSDAYLTLGLLAPPTHWAEREAIFRKGLFYAPDEPTLTNYLADIYSQVGRTAEALDLVRRAQALDPSSAPKAIDLARALNAASRGAEAKAVIERAMRLWPENGFVWYARLDLLATGGQPKDAMAMLDGPNGNPLNWEPEYVALWRTFISAMDTGSPDALRRASAAVRSALAAGQVAKGRAMLMFASLGDIDAVFGTANAMLADDPAGAHFDRGQLLFVPAMREARRDPRFMKLAARLSLTKYWIATGKWPDFCTEPGLGYDCAKAARAATGH